MFKSLIAIFFYLVSASASATQVLSAHNLTISLLHCHGDARLDMKTEIPRLIIHSARCHFVGVEDGQLTQLRTDGFDLKKNDVRLVSVQSPNGSLLDSFLVDTRIEPK